MDALTTSDLKQQTRAIQGGQMSYKGTGRSSSLIRTQQLDDVPELIHLIQSMLPVKDAARTSVLSKSWLHAWSTIPTLRFSQSVMLFNSKHPEKKYSKLINRTLLRYFRNKIPIESFFLKIFMQNNQELASHAEKWIRSVASKSLGLKEFSLKIWVKNIDSFTLPCEIFSFGINLDTISVSIAGDLLNIPLWIKSPSPHVMIRCVSLRVLELINVPINEDILNNLLSTCSLLEKINLRTHNNNESKTIKVKNLHRLCELKITSTTKHYNMDIVDVPSLRLFFYIIPFKCMENFKIFIKDSLRSVTELFLGGIIIDDTFFDMINSNLPFLESLSLTLGWTWRPESLVITCASVKRLTLICKSEQIHIQVFAPKLLFLCYGKHAIPDLFFPISVPKKIMLRLAFMPGIVDDSFFFKMRELLNLSSKFDIEIYDSRISNLLPSNLDVDNLRRWLPSPAMNVQQLSFTTLRPDEVVWEDSRYFDTLFSIFHPAYVKAHYGMEFKNKKIFSKLMMRKVAEKKNKEAYFWSDLKDVEIRNPLNGNWETLANYWKNFPDESILNDYHYVEFKLYWSSS